MITLSKILYDALVLRDAPGGNISDSDDGDTEAAVKEWDLETAEGAVTLATSMDAVWDYTVFTFSKALNGTLGSFLRTLSLSDYESWKLDTKSHQGPSSVESNMEKMILGWTEQNWATLLRQETQSSLADSPGQSSGPSGSVGVTDDDPTVSTADTSLVLEEPSGTSPGISRKLDELELSNLDSRSPEVTKWEYAYRVSPFGLP
jgi:hypothetical protein